MTLNDNNTLIDFNSMMLSIDTYIYIFSVFNEFIL